MFYIHVCMIHIGHDGVLKQNEMLYILVLFGEEVCEVDSSCNVVDFYELRLDCFSYCILSDLYMLETSSYGGRGCLRQRCDTCIVWGCRLRRILW